MLHCSVGVMWFGVVGCCVEFCEIVCCDVMRSVWYGVAVVWCDVVWLWCDVM